VTLDDILQRRGSTRVAAARTYAVLFAGLHRSIESDIPAVHHFAAALGSNLGAYLHSHPSVWERFFDKRRPPERDVLTALLDVEVAFDSAAAALWSAASASERRRVFMHLEASTVAIFAMVERLENLIKAAQRRRLISMADGEDLRRQVSAARRLLDNGRARHQVAHSAARQDGWLRSLADRGVWELMLYNDSPQASSLDPLSWMFDDDHAINPTTDEMVQFIEGQTVALDLEIGKILSSLADSLAPLTHPPA